MSEPSVAASRQVVLPAQAYVDGIRAGDRAMLARAITLIESTQPSHDVVGQDVLEALLPDTGRSLRLGLSGAPGVGKSTFIETFGAHVLAADEQHRVAVLAIDPTSPLSGGSVLGDKTRMPTLSQHPRAFIRPSPTVGTLGGVARRTADAILLCEAAGFNIIVIETVGVGQSETAVATMVDFFVVLLLAGGGDELQGIKRGILELADLLAINKVDIEPPDVVRRALADYRNAMRLLHGADAGDRVVRCSGLTGEGVDRIWELARSARDGEQRAVFEARRADQRVSWLWRATESALLASFHDAPAVAEIRKTIEADVKEGRLPPSRGAAQLLDAYRRKL